MHILPQLKQKGKKKSIDIKEKGFLIEPSENRIIQTLQTFQNKSSQWDILELIQPFLTGFWLSWYQTQKHPGNPEYLWQFSKRYQLLSLFLEISIVKNTRQSPFREALRLFFLIADQISGQCLKGEPSEKHGRKAAAICWWRSSWQYQNE